MANSRTSSNGRRSHAIKCGGGLRGDGYDLLNRGKRCSYGAWSSHSYEYALNNFNGIARMSLKRSLSPSLCGSYECGCANGRCGAYRFGNDTAQGETECGCSPLIAWFSNNSAYSSASYRSAKNTSRHKTNRSANGE